MPVDPRTDLFALGVILWELLAGRWLFKRGAEAPTLLALMQCEVPPPSSLRVGIDAAWDRFFQQVLQVDPERRFASAAVMLEALNGLPDARVGPRADQLGALVAELQADGPKPTAEEPATRTTASVDADDLPTRVDGSGSLTAKVG